MNMKLCASGSDDFLFFTLEKFSLNLKMPRMAANASARAPQSQQKQELNCVDS
jgi:hypothetical protein